MLQKILKNSLINASNMHRQYLYSDPLTTNSTGETFLQDDLLVILKRS